MVSRKKLTFSLLKVGKSSSIVLDEEVVGLNRVCQAIEITKTPKSRRNFLGHFLSVSNPNFFTQFNFLKARPFTPDFRASSIIFWMQFFSISSWSDIFQTCRSNQQAKCIQVKGFDKKSCRSANAFIRI